MAASEVDEARFFAAIASSGARALLIGRRYPTAAERLAAHRRLELQRRR